MSPKNSAPTASAPDSSGAFLFNSKQARKPAGIALIIQALALILCFSVNFIYVAFNSNPLPNFILFLLQASFACALAWFVQMAKWWRYIHFLFPLAIWLFAGLHLSNTFFFWGFVISASLFWTTFRSQVPFYPSRPAIWKQVAELLPDQQALRMIDIGSGIGDLSMKVAELRPHSQISGIEIAPLPWLISVMRAKLKRSAAKFKLGDYNQLNFANFDLVFAYLSPAAMSALWQKASSEMQPGSKLVSYEFPVPGVKPSQTLKAPKGKANTYIYMIGK